MPRFPIVVLFFAFLLVDSRKLTTEENEQNTKKCGVHFLGDKVENRPTKRSYGGRMFKKNEYPWTVILELKGDLAGICSGAMISQRHILSAAHCMLKMNETYNRLQCDTNRSYSAISVMRCPDEVSVYLSGNQTDCTDSGTCPYHNTYEVAKITVHNYEFCTFYNDLALIELRGNICETLATPICMPSENLELDEVLYAAGSGKDYSVPSTLTDPHRYSHGQQVVAQKLYGVDEPLHKILTLTFAKTILPGDSGGPLFQVDGADVHTLMGISSAANSTERTKADVGEMRSLQKHCSTYGAVYTVLDGIPGFARVFYYPGYLTLLSTIAISDMQAYYVDVRAYLDWICKYSGVCPIEDEQYDEPPTGTSNYTQENFKKDINS